MYSESNIFVFKRINFKKKIIKTKKKEKFKGFMGMKQKLTHRKI